MSTFMFVIVCVVIFMVYSIASYQHKTSKVYQIMENFNKKSCVKVKPVKSKNGLVKWVFKFQKEETDMIYSTMVLDHIMDIVNDNPVKFHELKKLKTLSEIVKWVALNQKRN